MEVTEVKVRPVANRGRVKAFASITLNGEFVVHELRVIEGPKGVFVAMPSQRDQGGAYRDIAHPITREARQIIESAVLSEMAMAEAQREVAVS